MGKQRILLSLCICFLLCGCSQKKTVEETMTDVVIIQNQSTVSMEAAADSGVVYGTRAAEETTGYAYTFQVDSDYDLKNLIRKYYDYMVEGDYDSAVYLTNDASRLDRERFTRQGEYIESVKSLTCYSMESMQEGTYIVVARCGVQTTLCEEVITMLEAFYVCTNENGSMYICGSSVGDEVASYNSIMLSDSTISDVRTEVAEDNSKLMDEYGELSEIINLVIPEDIFRYLYELPVAE